MDCAQDTTCQNVLSVFKVSTISLYSFQQCPYIVIALLSFNRNQTKTKHHKVSYITRGASALKCSHEAKSNSTNLELYCQRRARHECVLFRNSLLNCWHYLYHADYGCENGWLSCMKVCPTRQNWCTLTSLETELKALCHRYWL